MPLQDLSLQQLQSLHLAGRPGLHVPTLAAMFSACRSSGLRRPVLVEVKKLASDGGRQRFVQLVRWAGAGGLTGYLMRVLLCSMECAHAAAHQLCTLTDQATTAAQRTECGLHIRYMLCAAE